MEFGSILVALGVIFMVAFLVESLTEYLLGEPFNHFPKIEPFKWLLMYFAGAAGVGMAFMYQFDLIYLLSQSLSGLLGVASPITSITTAGIVVTGLGIGRGAGFIHGVVQGYFKKPDVSLEIGELIT